MKIVSLVGTRPQIIKEAILREEFKKNGIQEILVDSGQHYNLNMFGDFIKILKIKKPEYTLNVKSNSTSEMTAKIMVRFEKVILKEKPDKILVFGDTNTTLAGALVAAKLKISLAHIEAGIRSNPKDSPEEINRVVADHISNQMFCPSALAVDNLKSEGIINNVFMVGDIMHDLFKKMRNYASLHTFKNLQLNENGYVLVTLHRDYNVDLKENLTIILRTLEKINKKIKIVFPLHPRTNKMIKLFKLEYFLKNLTVTGPVDYLNLMGLLLNSRYVITDSGGLQKEAYYAKKHAFIIAPDTGWRELIECGWNKLCDYREFSNIAFSVLSSKYPENVYGAGDAGKKIVNILK